MGWPHRSLLIPTILVLLAQSASGYPAPVDFDGSLMRWNVSASDAPITYEVIADRPQDLSMFGSAVESAATLWSNVPGSYFKYAEAAEGEPARVTIKMASTLDGSAYSAGYAIFDEYDGTKPKHCSIFVVVDETVSYGGLAKTFLHEFGHCAGLGHTLIPEAIMSYSLDKNRFELDIDDEAALARLYPADGSKPRLPPGCAVGAATSGEGSSPLLALLLALPLLAVFTRRRLGCRRA